MRLWKLLLILAILAGGFGAGYAMKGRQPVSPAQIPAAIAPPSIAQNEPMPPGYDPSLVLPPPDMKGVVIDASFDIVRDQFKMQAGLKPTSIGEPPTADGPALPPLDPKLFPIDVPAPPPSVVLPVEIRAASEPVFEPKPLPPPLIRLPAPPEEPTWPAVVKPIIHRQLAASMYTNTRDIRLNFDVSRQGSSGIKAVELWGRRSSESEYECVDRMEGAASPFPTRLWSEGNYEFRIVFVSGTGVKSALPNRDHAPDIRVCLDTTPPVVEMLPPQADPNEPGSIKLRWKAEDKNIDDNPIRLEYSTDGTNWNCVTEATDWLPNTNEYAWKVPAGLPTALHLRVRARDKAGNIGESQSSTKFPVDLSVPEGRISGVVEELPAPREVPAPNLHQL